MQDERGSLSHDHDLSSLSPHSSRVGQVCDRCRSKRVKCNGAKPSCAACTAANVLCEVSATLKRKTRIRGFPTSEDARLIESLRSQNAELQRKLQAECETTEALRQELDGLTNQTQIQPHKISRSSWDQYPQMDTSTTFPTLDEIEAVVAEKAAYGIKHMGRLVYDESGTGRFAGSTTGVHFVLIAQEACAQYLNYGGQFPQSCYSLYLLQPTINGDKSPECEYGTIMSNYATFASGIRRRLSLPLFYYVQQIDMFLARWESFCPVLVKTEMVRDVQTLLTTLSDETVLPTIDYSTVMVILMVMVFNELCQEIDQLGNVEADELRKEKFDLAAHLLGPVSASGDLKALQAISLFAFYIQITGHSIWLLQLNSVMVRIAQSLGLHRHDRRFKHKSGLVELRRRIWWWIYLFDKITSTVHGLPRLINDTDVDNDMPADCILNDINAEQVSYPSPGETTSLACFNQSILLGLKLSIILEQLYTTTQRRDSVDKITRLDRKLRLWNQSFNTLPHFTPFEIGEPLHHIGGAGQRSWKELSTLWLQLLANIAMVLIHRPALTFPPETPEFAASLNACVKSSSVILDLLEDDVVGIWLRSIRPSGPNVVFQSALMHVYASCNTLRTTRVAGSDKMTTLNVISRAVGLLKLYVPGYGDPTSIHYDPGGIRSQWIGDAVSTLRSLAVALSDSSEVESATGLGVMAGASLPQTDHMSQTLEIQSTMTAIDSWDISTDWLW